MNVKVGEHKGEDVFIHTLILGDNDETKPVLVLCHGYAGSGALFFKIMKPLAAKFRLITFDIIGMGCSSRPDNFDESKISPEEALEYLVEHVEKWRAAMGLERFYLSAHSFGGFVCGHYALKYPQYVIKLLMLSPIGVRYDPEWEKLTKKERLEKVNERYSKPGGPPAWIRYFAPSLWDRMITPMWLGKYIGQNQTLRLIRAYVNNRQNHNNPDQADDVVTYMYQFFMLHGTTEYALMICFELGLYCKLTPLGHPSKLPTLQIPITFIYGDKDWVKKAEQNAGQHVIERH